ncbi:MAG: hypothetical protein EAZ32_19395 [Cytophagia bacterium]|nr:MAG: hypothetical protein EAZ38_01985 [Cytophagales bacterium]TAG34712.1 MAG: hypothetical protein EAZ32_19395 [Cytophagia bacterium]TAG76807.1 MAG: hypothetical protein EAZ22_17115 [Cytophagales bacterium]
MVSLQGKDTALFLQFGASAFNTRWLIVNLIQTTRTVNLNKLKQEIGASQTVKKHRQVVITNDLFDSSMTFQRTNNSALRWPLFLPKSWQRKHLDS